MVLSGDLSQPNGRAVHRQLSRHPQHFATIVGALPPASLEGSAPAQPTSWVSGIEASLRMAAVTNHQFPPQPLPRLRAVGNRLASPLARAWPWAGPAVQHDRVSWNCRAGGQLAVKPEGPGPLAGTSTLPCQRPSGRAPTKGDRSLPGVPELQHAGRPARPQAEPVALWVGATLGARLQIGLDQCPLGPLPPQSSGKPPVQPSPNSAWTTTPVSENSAPSRSSRLQPREAVPLTAANPAVVIRNGRPAVTHGD